MTSIVNISSIAGLDISYFLNQYTEHSPYLELLMEFIRNLFIGVLVYLIFHISHNIFTTLFPYKNSISVYFILSFYGLLSSTLIGTSHYINWRRKSPKFDGDDPPFLLEPSLWPTLIYMLLFFTTFAKYGVGYYVWIQRIIGFSYVGLFFYFLPHLLNWISELLSGDADSEGTYYFKKDAHPIYHINFKISFWKIYFSTNFLILLYSINLEQTKYITLPIAWLYTVFYMISFYPGNNDDLLNLLFSKHNIITFLSGIIYEDNSEIEYEFFPFKATSSSSSLSPGSSERYYTSTENLMAVLISVFICITFEIMYTWPIILLSSFALIFIFIILPNFQVSPDSHWGR